MKDYYISGSHGGGAFIYMWSDEKVLLLSPPTMSISLSQSLESEALLRSSTCWSLEKSTGAVSGTRSGVISRGEGSPAPFLH